MLCQKCIFSEESEHRTDFTFYLIIAPASVSSLFLLSVVLMVSLKFCQTTHFGLFDLASATLPAIPGSYASLSYAGAEGRQIYSYEFCLASDSRKEELSFLEPYIQGHLNQNASSKKSSGTLLHEQDTGIMEKGLEVSSQVRHTYTFFFAIYKCFMSVQSLQLSHYVY